MFLKTLKIDSAKIHRALCRVKTGDIADKRGKHPPHNKSSDEKIAHIKNHIQSFPLYRSHYCREDNPNKMYLNEGLNLSVMYRLYKEKLTGNNLSAEIVSQSMYEKIFYRDFNLSFKPPQKDTCKTCDTLNMKIKASQGDDSGLNQLKSDLELHHRKVELARDEMRKDKARAEEGACTVLSFDLQKTFLLPKVPTGVVYYKRQLTCLNLGIHDWGSSKGTMYLWHEGMAGRGPDEISSCVINYLGNNSIKKKVILWSDSCGGQNRNFKLVVRLLQLVQSDSNIDEIELKFAIPGHSFLPNDTDFAHIENKMRLFQHIYHPDQLEDIIKSSRTKKTVFDVIRMASKDFLSSDSLVKSLTNRKNMGDTEVSWLKIRCIKLSKTNCNQMEFKYSHSEITEYNKVSFAKRMKGRPVSIENIILQHKYPNGRMLDVNKINDLRSLLCFVPPVYHCFYEKLFETNNNNNDVELNANLTSDSD